MTDEVIYIAEGIKAVAKAGNWEARAILKSAGDDLSLERIYAEYLISEGMVHVDPWNLNVDPSDNNGAVYYDVQFVDDANERQEEPTWEDGLLLADKPEGTVVPPPSGRGTVQTPNLTSANPSFAALLIKYVRDFFDGDAPKVYRAAHVSRQTYSAIISNELRPVSKHVAIAFAFALRLSLAEAKELLRSAGHALSDFILEDIIFQACLIVGIYDINRVNQILTAHAAKPLFCQNEQSECLRGGGNLKKEQTYIPL